MLFNYIVGQKGNQGPPGPSGAPGIAGPSGLQGSQGIQGIAGPSGSQGIQGPIGPSGMQGVQGIAGPSGAQGIQGPIGPSGIQGIQGIQGVPGPSGSQGIPGPSGSQGIQGVTGPSGLMGPSGLQGPQGIQGPSGIQGPPGPSGQQGIPGASGTNDPQLRTDFTNASGIWVKDGINLGLLGSGIFTSKDLQQRLQFKKLIAGSNIILTGNSNSLTISSTASGTGGESNTASNVGLGVGVFDSKIGVDLRFHRILGGSGIEVRASGQTIILDNEIVDDFIILNSFANQLRTDFNNSSGVFIKTASNLGVGSQIFKQKAGQNLEFRTLIAGSGIQFTVGSSTITIDNKLQDDVDILYSRQNKLRTDFTNSSGIFQSGTDTANQVRTDFDNSSGIFVKTASNVGFGQGVFDSKVGSDLRFKKILGGSGIEVRASGQTLILDNELSDDVNVLYQRSNSIRTDFTNSSGVFQAGTNKANIVRIDFDNASGVWVKDGENLGSTGSGIFFTKSALKKLQFKKLKAGPNITIAGDNNSLTISAVSGVQKATTVSPVASANSVGTVQRFAPEDHKHAGIAQVQITGNTSNNSASFQGSLILSGGNNITLSQSTFAGGARIGISAPLFAVAVYDVTDSPTVGTVSRFAREDHQHLGIRRLEFATIVNTNNTTYNTTRSANGDISLFPQGALKMGWNSNAGASYHVLDVVGYGYHGISLQGNTTGTTNSEAYNAYSILGLFGGTNITLSAETDTYGIRNIKILGTPLATTVRAISADNSVGTVTRFAPEDHVHAGINYIQVTGNTSINSNPLTAGSFYISGGNEITVGIQTGLSNATLTISGRSIPIVSEFNPINASSFITNSAMGLNSLYVVPFFLPTPMYAQRLNLFLSIATTLSGNSSRTAGITQSVALYTRHATNQGKISSFWSGSAYVNIAASSNTNVSVTHPFGILTTGGSTEFSSSVFSQNNANASSYIVNSINGPRAVQFPIVSTLTEGQYWAVFARSTASQGGQLVLANSNLMLTLTQYPSFANFGRASAATNAGVVGVSQGLGVYIATSNAFPGSIGIGNNPEVVFTVTPVIPFFNFSGWDTGITIL